MKKVVLVLNMGGPNNIDEVEVFLKNMFNDPYILGIKNSFLRSILARIIIFFRKNSAKSNYKQIGGKSPIVDITQSLVDKINSFGRIYADFVMRYTPPFSVEVLKKYKDYDEIVLFPLYPHYSKTTVLSSLDDINSAIKNLNIKAKIKTINFFYGLDKYNEIILNLIKNKINKLNDNEISNTTLIFSAHSLPKKLVEQGDVYEEHIGQHFSILNKKIKEEGLNFKDIKLAYQSKLGPIPWLGPNLSDVLPSLKIKRALIFPIAFCIDNSETIYELDIEYRHIANKLKFDYYEVCKCPNDTFEFAKFIEENSLKFEEFS